MHNFAIRMKFHPVSYYCLSDVELNSKICIYVSKYVILYSTYVILNFEFDNYNP